MSELTAQVLVDRFLSGNEDLFECVRKNPEAAWEAIATLSKEPLTDTQRASLAAGALEEIIHYSGPAFIKRIEAEARRSRSFRALLGGVWEAGEPDVWRRIIQLVEAQPPT